MEDGILAQNIKLNAKFSTVRKYLWQMMKNVNFEPFVQFLSMFCLFASFDCGVAIVQKYHEV